MTPPQEPRTGGVAVWRYSHIHEECDPAIGECYATYEDYADEGDCEPGTWFPLAEAEALLVVVEKAREFLTGIDEGRIDTLALRNAVEALDA